MKTKSIITIIKNGQEQTYICTIWNIHHLLNEIFIKTTDKLSYQLNSDIDFIHFKNFPFLFKSNINCAKNTIVILEDCLFNSNINTAHKLSLMGGHIELINPHFFDIHSKQGNNLVQLFVQAEDFNLNLSKTKNLSSEIAIKATAKTISLSEVGQFIDSMNLTATNWINLVGKIPIELKMRHSYYLTTKELRINNYSLITRGEYGSIETQTIAGTNWKIQARDTITLTPSSAFYQKLSYYGEKNAPILTEQNIEKIISRAGLLSVLKAMKSHLSTEILNQLNQERTKELMELKKQKQALAKQQQQLNQKFYQLNQKTELKRKILERTKLKEIAK